MIHTFFRVDGFLIFLIRRIFFFFSLLHTGVMNGDIDILKYLLNATLTYNCKVKFSIKILVMNTLIH